jgi:(+)-pinoresinol hydroxylase
MSRTNMGWVFLAALTLVAGHTMAQDTVRLQRGHATFQRWCEGCHARGTPTQNSPNDGLVGRVWAGTYTLEQRYQGSRPAALEDRTDLQPEFIRAIVRDGLNIMPRTRKTEISDADLDELVAYLTRNNAASRR